MRLLPEWFLTNKYPTLYDKDSLTVIEQTARVYGAMNELIEEYNAHSESINKIIEEFISSTEKDQETFEVALRQEFQDFIDIVDLKLIEFKNEVISLNTHYLNLLESHKNEVNTKLTEQDQEIETRLSEQDQEIEEAVDFMKENIVASVNTVVDEMVANNEIVVGLTYNADEESIALSVVNE